MLGLGVGEVIIILVVALVVLGPTKLPQVARQVGKGLREFRKHASDLQHTFDEVAREAEREENERERKKKLAEAQVTLGPPEHLPLAADTQEGVTPQATAETPVPPSEEPKS
jgi:sec-independent protein translocase protein TatB